jgi:hypothetical protein
LCIILYGRKVWVVRDNVRLILSEAAAKSRSRDWEQEELPDMKLDVAL